MRRSKSKKAKPKRKPAAKAVKAAKPDRRRARRREPDGSGGEAVLAAFAHDIRTALTGILALGELLASSNLGERERRWAAGIKGSAEHLGALTTLVIDAARIDAAKTAAGKTAAGKTAAGKTAAGAITLQRDAFSPRRLLDAVAQSLAARAEMKGVGAESAIAADLPAMLVGDPVRLRAALENLIDNAVKFTERGAVRLEARATPAARGRVKLVVTISDTGIGLSAAELKRLFRPFAQASAEIARRFGGAGLGLVVVERLAKLMGGNLAVTSTPGRGARFSFSARLPLAPAGAAAGGAGAQPKAAPAKPLTILCAEDNPYGRVILNTILTELGHRADFVGSGEEAVEAVKRGYDVVLMDLTLPGIDGLEATRRIRALAGERGRSPIIGITGRSDSADEQAARAAGMDFYLRKPVSPSTLGAALAAVVHAHTALRSPS